MKVLVFFALVSLAAAQFVPGTLDSRIYGRRPWISSTDSLLFNKYNTWPLNTWSNTWGLENNIYGNDMETSPIFSGSYGPFSRFGGTIVPNYQFYHQYGGLYGNPSIYQPFRRQLYTPYQPISTLDTVLGSQSIYGGVSRDPLNLIENSVSPFNPLGDNVSPLSQISQLHHISPLNQQVIPSTYFNKLDITPFSGKALFNMLTQGNNWDVYAKTIIGRNKGLGRKLREVCPEIDGGLSFVSCVNEAHTRGYQCLKDVEDHPRYQVCTHKPIVKKFLREFLVTDMEHHKELVSCLSTTTTYDEINLKRGVIDGSRLGPDDDLSDEVANKEENRPHLKVGRFGYNVEVSANTRQCFYKLRAKVQECSELAKQCPKFRQCYEHPTIKTLKAQKHIAQAKYVKVMDMCLQGTPISTPIGTGITDDLITGQQILTPEFTTDDINMQNLIRQGDRLIQDLAF